jgi:hypothetical protein
MGQKAAVKPKRTTLAVSGQFGKKLTELAHGHEMTVAEYCDKHLASKVGADWRAMLARKLKSDPDKAGG